MTLRTPGVTVVAKDALPNSVVEVATAVPAFIGYTKQALNGGDSLAGEPWRIDSMADYERYFGGPPVPRFTVHDVTGAAILPPEPDMAAAPGQDTTFKLGGKDYLVRRQAGKAGGRFLMYQAMRHFFQNGGAACYIVSVGDYSADIAAGNENSGLIGGLTPLRKETEPTLLLVPEAVLLSRADCATMQAAMLKHCGLDTRSRFAILDVWGGDKGRTHDERDCVARFRDAVGTDFLDFGAAYYPWLNTTIVQATEVDDTTIANQDVLARLIAAEAGPVLAASDVDKAAQHKTLLATSALYARIMDEVRGLMNVVPPSAAMAGLYALVDNKRGVWKAPANVGVAGVVKPAAEISQADQEDLNVNILGKSINAIRSFNGEGALVWGARTLDGNSLDWRYINVRRTMIMLEQSCQLAAQAMVFEANSAGTWVTIKSMIRNFLTGVWKRGGLAGAVPEDAFSVQVGLGETMTPEDVLKGVLRVTVLVAISRPAEFIEITFQQQMRNP